MGLLLALVAVPLASPAQSLDLIPPAPPTALSAAAATCGQVDLTWTAASDEPGGSGLKGYTISRAENGYVTNTITIGALRTSFSDTNHVKASTTVTYDVTALDNAGNRSGAANTVTVSTPACPSSPGDTVVDDAYMAPFGKTMASYGSRTAIIYVKQNVRTMTWDTWLYVRDSDTGQTSRILLHASPGYEQSETDYVLTSLTDLWTVSHRYTMGGNVLVSQYKLNGSPVTSATLVSTKPLGDSTSKAKAMIRLKSGALLVAWSQEGWGHSAFDLTGGFAYRSPSGAWSVNSPVTIPNSGGGTIVMSQWTIAQHPADASVWAFVKRDSFHEISALHLTEAANGILVDWIKPDYITVPADGDNGPEGEYPFLVAASDPTRNAILLAYQSYRDRRVFIDPLYGSSNLIFLKDTPATIAEIRVDGSRTYLPFPHYMERCAQFGMSVLPDGTIWLAYQPINPQTLTWNEIYASKYEGGAWSAPAVAGYNYRTYNVSGGARDPGLLIYRLDLPHLAFLTPDEKIHTIALTDATPPASDAILPVAAITDPVNGATISGIAAVTATATDNVGVMRVDLLVDGIVAGSRSVAPYTFSLDTSKFASGVHTLQAVAYDAAGGAGKSPGVTVTFGAGATDTTAPSVALVTPQNGSSVPRNSVVSVSASAADNSGIARVEFYVGNTLIGTAASGQYSVNWKVPGKRNATYTVKAIAIDLAGNSTTATSTVTAN